LPGLFIEFGARDGLYESNTHLFEKYAKWQGLLVEANRFNIEGLRKQRSCIFNNKPKACVFAGLYSSENMTLSHSTYDTTKLVNNEDSDNSEIEHNVKTTTLNRLLHHYNIKKINFMSADCEGCETEALNVTYL
jgi:FkbM family methyltransferase